MQAVKKVGSKTGVALSILGKDGNAFAILGTASRALKRAGKAEQVKEFQDEATKGDYNHLLTTCMRWFEVE